MGVRCPRLGTGAGRAALRQTIRPRELCSGVGRDQVRSGRSWTRPRKRRGTPRRCASQSLVPPPVGSRSWTFRDGEKRSRGAAAANHAERIEQELRRLWTSAPNPLHARTCASTVLSQTGPGWRTWRPGSGPPVAGQARASVARRFDGRFRLNTLVPTLPQGRARDRRRQQGTQREHT